MCTLAWYHHRVLERHSSSPAAAVSISYPYRIPPFARRARRLPSLRLVIHRLPPLRPLLLLEYTVPASLSLIGLRFHGHTRHALFVQQ